MVHRIRMSATRLTAAAMLLAPPLLAPTSMFGASPAVEATLALPRTEPRHYVESALALVDLRATEPAEKVVAELLALNLSAEQQVVLVDSVGTARLTRLARAVPAAQPLLNSVLDAANAAATSPNRLASLVEALGGERGEAIEAIRALRRTGKAGVAYCLDQIAASDDTKVRARLREALVALDPISLPALFEATGSENEVVRAESAYALGRLAELGRLRSPIAPALVAGEAFTPGTTGDAARWAYRQITGTLPTLLGAKAQIDAAIDELLGSPVLFADSSAVEPGFAMRLAARLAADRARLDPSDAEATRHAMLLAMEAGNEPATDLPTYELVAAVADALDLRLHTAAAAVATVLGERGDSAALFAGNDAVSPLVRALDSPHPSVRFAAAEAILAINPQQPFAGSNRLSDTLLQLAAATGDDTAVVAYPQLAKASALAGWLLASGYTAVPVNRGADVVRVATEGSDTTIVLLDLSTSLPNARETLFRLRRSPTTALMPVALLAADGRLADAQRLAEEHGDEAGAVIAVARPHSLEATQSLAERLVAMLPADWPTGEERLAQAEAARAAIAKLLESDATFYGLQYRSDRVVSLVGFNAGEASLEALVALGTPESQTRLIDAASLDVRPLEKRQAAAEAFAESLRDHGLLLTTDQIRRQYDRYNASATAPAETQDLLGGLLDLIEGAAE
ncbi:MAG: hypothetical protein AAF266_03765 [Planctomycetota bacterium]